MPRKKNTDAQTAELPGVAAASRALTILSAFRTGDKNLSLAELSRRTQLYKSTILRLTQSLESFGYLLRQEDGDYVLGHELIRLGGIASSATTSYDVISASLRRLVAETGESSTFYVARGDFRLALLREDSPRTVRDHIRVGDLLPLDKGAAAHVLTRVNDGEIAVHHSLGERDPDLAAVAGPVYEHGKLIGAIQVSGPISRLDETRLDDVRKLVEVECQFLHRALRR
ncbi:IclR family transcriptional regulator [Mesorhizobium australicum]|uniref:Transcriptional regulator, IclR family n=1 Tax=Mesorhizobium australicum TaxID=536018 RepID=A0A1X7MSF0_9HYPH|nr:helix-turn-helix domain-containing protein [Mesorhizobium australicum]SMH27750.1 transcriptional regulator, IclR family [Mesorhizobium australicum]